MNEFRHRVYSSFEQAADALFNTVDALASETAAQSFPELSLSPFFVRRWPSLYEAFEDGKIDLDRLREAFVQFAPLPGAGQHVFLGVDTSSLFRAKANRVFYRPAPARQPGPRGASRLDGARFQCSDPSTRGDPDASWEGTDAHGKRVEVHCWHQLHLRTARWVEVSVIQVVRHGASERPRDPKIS